jgi:LPPG:FO 2-phospho-L-lactate transferase
VYAIAFEGAARAKPAPGVIEAIADADLIVIAPSNPLISIAPILAVSGIPDALRRRREQVVSVCPLVGGKSLKGPTDKMMAQLGYDVSPAAVAKMYADFCGSMILDAADEGQSPGVEGAGVRALVLPTVMQTEDDKIRLAQSIMDRFA